MLAGLDLNCGSFLGQHTQAAVTAGKLKESDVDKAITNNFVVLMRLGFFDGDPRKLEYGSLGPKDVCTAEHQELAREAARQGIVLLKNDDDDALPLDPKSIKSLAVIGPNANVTKTMIGNYEGINAYASSILSYNQTVVIGWARRLHWFMGQARTVGFSSFFLKIFGSLLFSSSVYRSCSNQCCTGTPCKYTTPLQGLAAVVSTVYQPGCTNVGCAGNSLQLDAAKAAAAQADATVLVVGADQSIERESFDRVDLLLPGQQTTLVTEIAKAANGKVILVIMSGGPFDISFAKSDDRISSILWVGYPGEAGGAALADIIFGYYNPCGRLPVTWYPQSFADKVPMTDMRMRPDPSTGYPGRTYRFYTGDVVYSFGDGLSYNDFTHHLVQAPKLVSIPLEEGHSCYSKRCKSVDLVGSRCENAAFDIHLRVQNPGRMAGSHTVFLFSSPPSVHSSPQKHLLGFEKIYLGPQGVGNVVFKVDVCKDLSLVDEVGNRKVALGSHILHVGNLKHSINVRV